MKSIPLIEFLYRLLKCCNATARYPKNLEEFIVKGLCLTLLVVSVLPLLGKFRRAGANFIPGESACAYCKLNFPQRRGPMNWSPRREGKSRL